MMKIKELFIIAIICSSANLYASEEKSIDQKLSSLKLEKAQAELIVAAMIKRGHINNEEGLRIKREIASEKEQDIEAVKAEAIEKLDLKNSFATK
jgi:polyhydroxyalkanoate synthesis regulator phasin